MERNPQLHKRISAYGRRWRSHRNPAPGARRSGAQACLTPERGGGDRVVDHLDRVSNGERTSRATPFLLNHRVTCSGRGGDQPIWTITAISEPRFDWV